MDLIKFGERLAIYRQNKNMTQEEFASRMGVTPQAVSKWERGLSLPDVSLIQGICNVLDVDANEVLNITSKSRITESNDISEQKKLLSNLCAEPVKVTFGADMIPAVVAGLKTKLISEKRLSTAKNNAMLIPIIRMTDDENLPNKEFRILFYDKVLYKEEFNEIDASAFTYIIDKLFQICIGNYALIINKQIIKILIDNVKTSYPGVADEVIPEKISYLFVQRVLEGLLSKNESIHNLIAIIEIMEEEVLTNCNTDVETIVNAIINTLHPTTR